MPAYNEAETIADVVKRGAAPSCCRSWSWTTGPRRNGGRSASGRARCIAHPVNLGKGHAVRTGLAHLLRRRRHARALLDGDMQHLPEEAARLLDAARATGADVVIGERRFNRRGMPASRYHANRIGSRALSQLRRCYRSTIHSAGFACFAPTLLREMRLSARRLRHRD